jgi:xanthine/uracil permease
MSATKRTKSQEGRPPPWQRYSLFTWALLAFTITLITLVLSLASYSLIDRVIAGVLVGIVYGCLTAGIMGLVRYFKRRPK